MKKQSIQEQPDRILARRLAREIPKDQLGRISGGWRTLGRAEANRDRKTGTGYDYVHSLLDDDSRLA